MVGKNLPEQALELGAWNVRDKEKRFSNIDFRTLQQQLLKAKLAPNCFVVVQFLE
jgi:hypothetical protein